MKTIYRIHPTAAYNKIFLKGVALDNFTSLQCQKTRTNFKTWSVQIIIKNTQIKGK